MKSLGEAVKERRRDLELTQIQAVSSVSGSVSESTWRHVEQGRTSSLSITTKRAIAKALRWPPDAVERILNGEDPAASPTIDPAPQTDDDIARQIAIIRGDIGHLAEQLAYLIERLDERQ